RADLPGLAARGDALRLLRSRGTVLFAQCGAARTAARRRRTESGHARGHLAAGPIAGWIAVWGEPAPPVRGGYARLPGLGALVVRDQKRLPAAANGHLTSLVSRGGRGAGLVLSPAAAARDGSPLVWHQPRRGRWELAAG